MASKKENTQTPESFTNISPKATPTAAGRDVQADLDLRHACLEGNLAEVKRILDTGRADVNWRYTTHELTPLQVAAGVKPWSGSTPVLAAARWKRRDVVELLVRHGADVSLVDSRGSNILHWACYEGDRETVEFVLSLDRVDVNCRNENGMTPVMLAAWMRHKDVVEVLVSHGADVTLLDKCGDSTLHHACFGGDRETVEFVLSLGGVDVNAKNNRGKTAADRARYFGYYQLLELLESRGAVK